MVTATSAVATTASWKTTIPVRICLIIPPSGFLLDDRVFMTLGILRLAAVLEKAGSIVEVLDLSGIKNFIEVTQNHVVRSEATIFGLTATTPQLPPAIEILSVIRASRPDARVILGGPHATLANAAHKSERKRGISLGRGTLAIEQLTTLFDVVVAGDGEDSIFVACHPESPRLVDGDDPKSVFFLTSDKLNTLPWPARHLVDVASYNYTIEGAPAISLIAQLGCPFNCGFCGGRESPMLRRIRTRTTENIVAEIEHLWRTTGKTGFMFYDDELNVNKKMIELMDAIAGKQKELGVEWKLRGFIKSELFTNAQAEAMYKAGFRWILVGFESGAERILTNINKKATKEENTRCLEIARRNGLKVKALMSMGHPGETEETIEETRQWLLEVRPDDFDMSVITCYPGTPYYDQAVKHPTLPKVWVYTYQNTGDKLYQIEIDYTLTADYYKGDPDGGYRAYVYTDTVSSENLIRLRDNLERTVRAELGIPFNTSAPAKFYEHSMGQHGQLPEFVLRQTK